MAALATVANVEERWRPLSTEEYTVAAVLLDDASALIRLRFPTIDARIAASADLAQVVIGVVAAMVLRVLQNPDGKVQESIEDYSYRRSDAVADGLLYVTGPELAELTPGSDGAFSIILPTREWDEVVT